MKDSLAYRGPILWNLVNFNEKNVSFKELKKRVTARDYFNDFIFNGTAVSTLVSLIEHFTCIYYSDVVSIHDSTSL